MRHFIVRDAQGSTLLEYNHTEQLVFAQWPGCVQEEVVQPEPQPPVYSGSWRITKFAFRARFAYDEKIAIELAGLDNPNGNQQARGRSAALRVYQQDIVVATFVDLKRPDVRAGVQSLEDAGLLAPGRAAVILDTPPIEDEVWNG